MSGIVNWDAIRAAQRQLEAKIDEVRLAYKGPHNAVAAYCMPGSDTVRLELGDYNALDKKTDGMRGFVCVIRRLRP